MKCAAPDAAAWSRSFSATRGDAARLPRAACIQRARRNGPLLSGRPTRRMKMADAPSAGFADNQQGETRRRFGRLAVARLRENIPAGEKNGRVRDLQDLVVLDLDLLRQVGSGGSL